jgi:hypothetical protein
LIIYCPQCKYQLRGSRKLIGTKGQCKQCQFIFTIGDLIEPSMQSPQLVFACPKCNQLFDGKPEMRGRKGKCHMCGEVFPIQLKFGELPERQPIHPSQMPIRRNELDQLFGQTRLDGTDGSLTGSSLTGPERLLVSLLCGCCGKALEVSAELAGQTTPCPHCFRLLQVPSDL